MHSENAVHGEEQPPKTIVRLHQYLWIFRVFHIDPKVDRIMRHLRMEGILVQEFDDILNLTHHPFQTNIPYLS